MVIWGKCRRERFNCQIHSLPLKPTQSVSRSVVYSFVLRQHQALIKAAAKPEKNKQKTLNDLGRFNFKTLFQ